MKTDKYFKFRGNRDSGCIKLVFFPSELKQKPIKYWSNVGSVHKSSRLNKLVKLVKGLIDDVYNNNIHYLSFYAGSRLTFPYHVSWMGDRFEMTVYNVFGDGNCALRLGRNVTSDNERFTDDEIKEINNFLHREHHIISKSYPFVRELFKNIGNTDYYKMHTELKNRFQTWKQIKKS